MEKEERRLKIMRKKLEKRLTYFVGSTEYLLESLKNLNDEQIAAVVAFGYLMQCITQAKSPVVKLGDDSVVRFEKELAGVSPNLARARAGVSIFNDCFDYDVAYATAMKKCEDEGKREDECRDAHGPGAAAIYCRMEKLEEVQGILHDLFDKLKPPKPFPLPNTRG
jgi:hypothetical protein